MNEKLKSFFSKCTLVISGVKMKRKLWIIGGLLLALGVGYGTAYAQSIRIHYLGPWSNQGFGDPHGAYRIDDGPNVCYVAKGVESISIYCLKK